MFACFFFCRSILANGMGKGRRAHIPCKDIAYTQFSHSCLAGQFRPAVTSSFKGSRNTAFLSYWKNIYWRMASQQCLFTFSQPNPWVIDQFCNLFEDATSLTAATCLLVSVAFVCWRYLHGSEPEAVGIPWHPKCAAARAAYLRAARKQKERERGQYFFHLFCFLSFHHFPVAPLIISSSVG